MIFSEIYGLYFRTMEKLIAEASSGTLDRESFCRIVRETAFSESELFIESAIKSGEWKVIDESYNTPYEFSPRMPLTETEKRWIKTVSLDKKFKLFIDEVPSWLEKTEPLFSPDDILYPDRFSGGDDYESEDYRKIFKTILKALKEDRKLHIAYKSGKGYFHEGDFVPRRLEYSPKEDKFRLYTGNIFKNNILNLGRIVKCCPGDPFRRESLLPLKIKKLEVRFELTNERNCLERALIHFSSFEKETVRLERKKFLVTLRYNENDESEILIRLLQFGQFVKVVAPEYMVNLIKERIFNQKSC